MQYCYRKGNTIPINNDDDEISHFSLEKCYRSRRKNSGYFSNLSTFDDNRNSTTIEILQDIVTYYQRRRSSAKRLNLDRFSRDDINNERMPSTEIYHRISTAGLEMPNIEELKEIQEDVNNSSLSKDNLVHLALVKQKLMNKNRITSLNNSTFDVDNNRDITTNMSEIKEIDEITTRLRQSLTSDETLEFDDKLFKNIFSPLREASSNILSLTKVNSHFQEEPANHKECSSSRRIVTPMKFESAGISESSSTSISSSRSQCQRKGMNHSYSSMSSFNTELQRILEKPHDLHNNLINNPITTCVDDNDDVAIEKMSYEGRKKMNKILPRSIKVYQFLSTQSEDRGDDEPRLIDRRISLQISRHADEQNQSTEAKTTFIGENKKLPHCDRLSFLQSPPSTETNVNSEMLNVNPSPSSKKIIPPDKICFNQNLLGNSSTVGIKSIHPYYPYSPYGSPQVSPRARRRPLRESRRVSIDNRQGALQLNQYKLLDNIGQGSYGIVKLAYNEEDETHYAMKILSKKKLMKKAGIFGRMAPGRKGAANPLAKVYREIAVLKKLDHPNVVKLVEVLDDPDEDNLYLVFELIEKGEVLQLPTDKPLDEEIARKSFRDIVLGVEYLHYQKIVHRDIKPSNLLVDSEGHVKVADLGVSAELRASNELLSGSAGTPAFAAPETTILGAQYSGTKCDVWSMGVTLYSLVTGRVPWDGAGNIIAVQAAVRTEPLRFPEKPELSDNLRHLISRMLNKDPTTRLTLQEIKSHCWLTNNGKDPLPSETDNCRLQVTVTDEEVARVVTRVPKLDTLILIKTMLKQHSFQNPFLSKRTMKLIYDETISKTSELLTINADKDMVQTTTSELIKNKTEQFHRAGRSNSAPDSYEWQSNAGPVSADTLLPSVTESSAQVETVVDERRHNYFSSSTDIQTSSIVASQQ